MKPIIRSILYTILIFASGFVAVLFWGAAIFLIKMGLLAWGTLLFVGLILLVAAVVVFIYLEENN